MDPKPIDRSKGTVWGPYACVPHLRYRKALPVEFPANDPYDDHMRVIPGQEYPRWLKKPHPPYCPTIECMDFEFEVGRMDDAMRHKVRLWAIPNKLRPEGPSVVLMEWTCTAEFIYQGGDGIYDCLLHEAMRQLVKTDSARPPASQPD